MVGVAVGWTVEQCPGKGTAAWGQQGQFRSLLGQAGVPLA